MLYSGAYIKLLLGQTRETLSVRIFHENVPFQQQRRKYIKMAKKFALVAFVLSLVVSTVLCQTFQYSRGWTNGKRSELPSSMGISNPGDERFANGEPKRLKMLMYGNADDQPLLVYCDLVDSGKLRKLVHTDNYASQLRREKGQNDDNY